MRIKQAVLSDLSIVKKISEVTISEIYPHYYPKGAVDFFLTHHSEANILSDIRLNRVFLCLDAKQNVVGTVTIRKNEICRLLSFPHTKEKDTVQNCLTMQRKKFPVNIQKSCWTLHCQPKRYISIGDIEM